MALRLTQPLSEMNTRNIPGGKGRPGCEADNLTAICERICLENMGAPTSHNPMGLHGLLHRKFDFLSIILELYSEIPPSWKPLRIGHMYK
jgi:hypothetical protein